MGKSSISQRIYNNILDMVLSMTLKPGQRVSENSLAMEYGCSRAPIREALKKLENEGIVCLYPHRFAEIASYDDEQVKRLGVARVFHDISVLKLSLLNGSNAEFKQLLNIAKLCRDAAKQDDYKARIRNDCSFHLGITAISKNDQLIKFGNELYKRIEFIQATRYNTMLDPCAQYEEHCQIVDLLIKRNHDEVIRLVTKHDASFHNITNDYESNFFI